MHQREGQRRRFTATDAAGDGTVLCDRARDPRATLGNSWARRRPPVACGRRGQMARFGSGPGVGGPGPDRAGPSGLVACRRLSPRAPCAVVQAVRCARAERTQD